MGGTVSSGFDNDDFVNNLLESDYIRSNIVEKVFRAVDRAEYFLPAARFSAYKGLAWKNGHLHISAPCIYGEVMEALCLKPGLSFLNLGSGTGYLSTMIGLILGSNGVNHGVEIYEDVVDYANQKLDIFKRYSGAVDEYDFCEPRFMLGNCLCLTNDQQYDRVYCGASCPEPYLNYMKSFLKIGGILVMPMNDQLIQIKRSSQVTWETQSLIPVSFANLILPSADKRETLELFRIEPYSLQVLCRAKIRNILRKVIDIHIPDLEKHYANPKANKFRHAALRRLVEPLFLESDSSSENQALLELRSRVPTNRYEESRNHIIDLVMDHLGYRRGPPIQIQSREIVIPEEHRLIANNGGTNEVQAIIEQEPSRENQDVAELVNNQESDHEVDEENAVDTLAAINQIQEVVVDMINEYEREHGEERGIQESDNENAEGKSSENLNEANSTNSSEQTIVKTQSLQNTSKPHKQNATTEDHSEKLDCNNVQVLDKSLGESSKENLEENINKLLDEKSSSSHENLKDSEPNTETKIKCNQADADGLVITPTPDDNSVNNPLETESTQGTREKFDSGFSEEIIDKVVPVSYETSDVDRMEVDSSSSSDDGYKRRQKRVSRQYTSRTGKQRRVSNNGQRIYSDTSSDSEVAEEPFNPYKEYKVIISNYTYYLRIRIQELPLPPLLKNYLNFYRDF